MIEANDPNESSRTTRLVYGTREFISTLYGDTTSITEIDVNVREGIEVGSFEVWDEWEEIINNHINDDDIFGTADNNYPIWA